MRTLLHPSSASLHLRLQGEAFDHNAGWGQGVWWSVGATLYGSREASCFNIVPLGLTSCTLCLCACHYSRVNPRSGGRCSRQGRGRQNRQPSWIPDRWCTLAHMYWAQELFGITGWRFSTLFFPFVSLLIQDQAYNKSQSVLQLFDLHLISPISLTHFTQFTLIWTPLPSL